MNSMRYWCGALVLGIAGLLVFIRPALTAPEVPVDFVYFRGQEVGEIEASFAVPQTCRGGVFFFPQEGLVIDALMMGKKKVEPLESTAVTHGSSTIAVPNPGAGFSYRLKLAHFAFFERGKADGVRFLLGSQEPPEYIDIEYRVRCLNGGFTRSMRVRGTRYDLPRSTNLSL